MYPAWANAVNCTERRSARRRVLREMVCPSIQFIEDWKKYKSHHYISIISIIYNCQIYMKKLITIITSSVAFASLCCLSSVVIVALGLGSVSFAASLADTFYGEYKWYFRVFWLICLTIWLIWYFRSEGICTLDHVKRERKRVINTLLIALFTGVIGYLFFLYVVVHYIWVWQGIWR